MLIENDIDSALRLADMLRKKGHESFLAEARYFLEDIREHGPFDMVITEIFLKDVSGLQIVLGVKALDPSIKVVAMSGGTQLSMSGDYLDYAREFGADEVLRKPVAPADLENLLDRIDLGMDWNSGLSCPLAFRPS